MGYKLDQENYRIIKHMIIDLSKVLESLKKRDLKNLTSISKDLQEINENCERDSKAEIKISIVFFGAPGMGKSSVINDIIGKKILKSSEDGKTCTLNPVVCSFHNSDRFSLIKIKDKNEIENIKFKLNEIENMRKKLLELSDQSSFDYLKILIPIKILDEKRRLLLKYIELIDTLGVPDSFQENCHELNKCIARDFELDAVFFVKRTVGRYRVTLQDFIELKKCGFFNSVKNRSLKFLTICSNKVFNEEQDLLIGKGSCIDSFINFTKKLPKDEKVLNTLKKYEEVRKTKETDNELNKSEQNDENNKILLSIKNKHYKDTMDRIDSILWNYEENEIECLREVINELIKYKQTFYFQEKLLKIQNITRELKEKIFSLSRRNWNQEFDTLICRIVYVNKTYRTEEARILAKIPNLMRKYRRELTKSYETDGDETDSDETDSDETDSDETDSDETDSHKTDNEETDSDADYQKDSKRSTLIKKLKTGYQCLVNILKDRLDSIEENNIEFNKDLIDNNEYVWEKILSNIDEDIDEKIKEKFKDINQKIKEKFKAIPQEIIFRKDKKNDLIGVFNLIENTLSKINKHLTNDLVDEEGKIKFENIELKLKSGKNSISLPNCKTDLDFYKNKIRDEKDSDEQKNIIEELIKKLKTEHRCIATGINNNALSELIKKILVENCEKWKRVDIKLEEVNFNYANNNFESFGLKYIIGLKIDETRKTIEVNLKDDNQKKAIRDRIRKISSKDYDFDPSSTNNSIASIDYPIFFLIKNLNLINLLQFLRKIPDNIDYLIVLFIEKKSNIDADLKKFIDNNQLKSYENKLIIFLVDSSLNNRIKIFSLMLQTAKKFLKVKRFYSICENIDCFLEFIGESFTETDSSLVNSLKLMNKILVEHQKNSDIDFESIKIDLQDLDYQVDKRKYIMKKINPINEQTTLDEIKGILNECKNHAIRNKSNEEKLELIENQLNKKDNLGFVSLIKSSNNDELIKLGSSLYSSHKVVKPKTLDVVLYDADIMSNIYPINQDLLDKDYDKYYFYYHILNNIGNYVLHYFSYDTREIQEQDLISTYLAEIKISRNSNSTSTNQDDIELPEFINYWQTFESFRNMKLDDELLTYRYRNFDRQREFNIEEECRTYIFNILDWVFNENIFFNPKGEILKNFQFIYQQDKQDGDLILAKKDDQNFRFVDIEIKKPNVINKSMFNGKRLDQFIKTKMVTERVLNCVKQTYKYISKHELKYGILTTLNESWFFKLTNDNKTLLISDTIDISDFLKAIYYLIKGILIPELHGPSKRKNSDSDNKKIEKKYPKTQ